MNADGVQTRFVFSGIGTKGDVLPLLAVATEMKRRGHAVHLLANDAFGGLAQRYGVGFTAVTAEQKNNLISSEENLNQHVMPSYEPTFEYFRQQMPQPGPLVVVNLDEFSASNVMAELYGLQLCRIQLAPWRIRSLIRPPWPFREEVVGRMLSTAFRKYTLPALYGHQERCVTFVPLLNLHRERVGLPPAQSTLDIDAHITLRLGFFPEWYAKPEADWPAGFELVGFPLAKSTGVLPAELEAFIEREGKPLVFTPGTGVVNVQRFFESARRCCEALNLPGVFLSPHLSSASGDFGPRIRHYRFLDLELMLREAALLIHHGGIGTTARALQAGVPQIIRPAMYDQFDNGDRVRLLGVGSMLLPEHYSPEKLIELVRELTTSAQVKANLQRFRDELAGTDAVSLAADALERAVRQQNEGLELQHAKSHRPSRYPAFVVRG